LSLAPYHYGALVVREALPHLRHDGQQLRDRDARPHPSVHELAPDLVCARNT
jgi:hypothetical protein